MNMPSRLFPVYKENEDTTIFFVPAEVIIPTVVDYPKDDFYGRGRHLTQFLQLPLNVPNYLALCGTQEQRCWGICDQIDPFSIRVAQMLLTLKVNGVEQTVFLNTSGHSNNSFIPSQADDSEVRLSMILRLTGGFSLQNVDHEKIGKEVFSDFKSAGYEPLVTINLAGSFNKQRFSLMLRDAGSTLASVRNLESGAVLRVNEVSEEVLKLMKSVEVSLSGVKLYQVLK